MKVIAVMPAFREETRISGAILGMKPLVDAIVVVDDGSGDATPLRAKEAGAIVLRHSLNRGQGAALRTGTDAALKLGADIVLHVDADGQHDPEYVPALLEPVKQGKADVVFGSRFLGNESESIPFARRLVLAAAKRFNAFALGIPHRVTDPQSGLRAMTASAARKIDFRQDRMAHCSEILRIVTRSDLRWIEVPARVHYTAETLAKGQGGVSSPVAAFRIVWELLVGAFS
ncbi:glycosyltransferase family 2 protein [Patescibacteria group bacterium]|jgi:glycosyltransferase involved in cell wall biosynthesis|nr:glycosyltransferase family 2 protein [Patescibacteria group bacterium]